MAENLDKLFDSGEDVEATFNQGQDVSGATREPQSVSPESTSPVSKFARLAEMGQKAQDSLDSGAQTGSDLARGAGQGLTFGFSDELAGGAQAIGDVLTGAKGEDFLRLYRQHQQEQQAANEEAKARSPIAYNVGDYGSTLLGGLVTAGPKVVGKLGAKALAKLAGKGAIAGGTQAAGRSKATIEENPMALAGDIGEGMVAGAILAPVLGKAFSRAPKATSEEITQSPLTAQLKEAYRTGRAGMGFNKSKNVLSREVAKEAENVAGVKGVFDTAEKTLVGEKKGLLEASKAIIQPEAEKVSQIQPFLDFAGKSGEIARRDLQEVSQGLELYANGGLSATAADSLRKKVQEMASGVQDPNVRGSLDNLAKELGTAIETIVPGYKEANKNISGFLKAGRETLLSRGHDPKVSQLRVSNLPKEDLATENELQRIFGSLRNYQPGTTQESQGAVNKTIENLKNLQQSNPEIFERLGINIPGLERQIYSAADRTALADKLIPGALGDLKPGSSMFGIPAMGEKGLLKAANLGGQAVKKSSDLYKVPKEGLAQAASRLQNSGIPGLSSLGDGLMKTLESGDKNKTNAALFTILQNPAARKILGYSPERQNEESDAEFGQ